MVKHKLSIAVLVIACIYFMAGAGHMGAVAAFNEDDLILLPEIVSFAVSPDAIEPGGSATLIWSVRNATSISIDHDVGGVGAQGAVQVCPLYSTTYKITAMNSAGVRSRYITLTVSYGSYSDSSSIIDCDPVTGRNTSVDMRWEQFCLSSQYQVQIARDPGFTLKIFDSGVMEPAEAMTPACWLAPGGLEAGHTYYWRVRARQAATGQYIISPWSEPESFTVRPGYAVSTGYYGLQALTPSNGCAECPVSPVSFSWSGYPNTTKYRFILGRDSQLQNVVVEDFTTTTSYELKGTLEHDTSYFWQVSAVEPVPSDTSAVFTFHTTSAPAPVMPQSDTSMSSMPAWAMGVVIIGVALVAVVIFMLIRARKK